MENLIIVFLILFMIILIWHRNQSNYPASSTATQRVASFTGYNAAATVPWKDLDRTVATGYTGCIAAGDSVGVGWNNASLVTINDYVWNGIPAGSALTAPSGVTFGSGNNVWGYRKEFTTNSDGSAGGGGLLYFLTGGNPVSKLTVDATVAGFFVDTDGSRYSIPNAACLQKSMYDPQAPVNCAYTPGPTTCSATICGTYGRNQFSVSAITTPASHDGTCSYSGTNITTTGQVLTITPSVQCQAPMCGWVTTPALNNFISGASACNANWETWNGTACITKSFKLTSYASLVTPTTAWYLYYDTATSAYALSTVDNNSYYKYDPTAKTLAHYASNGTLIGYLYHAVPASGPAYLTLAASPSGNGALWTAAFDSTYSKWTFRNDSTTYYLYLGAPFAKLQLTTTGQFYWAPVFI